MTVVDESGASSENFRKGKKEASRKCEKMINTYYIIYDFMVEKLKLSGVTLLVYALIHSFTKSGDDCYGTLEYIAKRVGASRTSVYRALKELVKNGYLFKHKQENNGRVIYVANLKIEFQNEISGVSNSNMEDFKMTPNNKEIKKPIITNNHSYIQGKSQGNISFFGPKKIVAMTIHQYVNLMRAAGVFPTLDYIKRLEIKILLSPEGSYKNHYQTIINWARRDGLVDEEGEIILAN